MVILFLNKLWCLVYNYYLSLSRLLSYVSGSFTKYKSNYVLNYNIRIGSAIFEKNYG